MIFGFDFTSKLKSTVVAINFSYQNFFNLFYLTDLAFPKRYKFYKSGVLPSTGECLTMEPNHAAEVIGYGTENGMKYWLLKNSWSEWWV